MLQSRQITNPEFITLTTAGLKVADFTQIRDSLISFYKSTYGQDIDVSTASADGVFINNLALIINNILQSIKTMYVNLDPNSATGTYLESLCRLANVTRKQASRSTVVVVLKNISSAPTGDLQGITCIDANGTEWSNTSLIPSLQPNEERGGIVLTCSEIGPVSAPPGSISQTIDISTIIVKQPEAATLGLNEETDSELRARRSQSTGQDGATVLENLVGAILELSGIRDVKIYNNDSNTTFNAKDGTTLPAHDIYIILRKLPNVALSNAEIGNLIYQKLTPGIHTTQSAITADRKEYDYSDASSYIVSSSQKVNWREATPIAPKITITITTSQFFTEDEFEQMSQSMFDYLNNLPLSTNLNILELQIEAAAADPKPMNRTSYTPTQVSVQSTDNKDTYFNYTKFEFARSSSNPTTYTWSLS